MAQKIGSSQARRGGGAGAFTEKSDASAVVRVNMTAEFVPATDDLSQRPTFVAEAPARAPIGEWDEVPVGRHPLLVDVVPVSVARDNIAGLMRAAEQGHSFLIQNTRMGGAPKLLIDLKELARHLETPPLSSRTLGEALRALPFRGLGASELEAAAPFDGVPDLEFEPPELEVGR